MSGSSDEEISNADRDGYRGGGSDGDDDDDDEDDSSIGKKQRGRRIGGCFAKDNMGKAKQVMLLQFTKAKTKFRRIRSRRPLLQPSSSVNANSTGTRIRTRSGTGCRFCFARPKVLESPNESPTSDPNDPKFTRAMLRTLIETNDFYSKECNVHLD